MNTIALCHIVLFFVSAVQSFTFTLTADDCLHGVMTLSEIRQISRCLPVEGVYSFMSDGYQCTYIVRHRRAICNGRGIATAKYVCATIDSPHCPTTTTIQSTPTTKITSSPCPVCPSCDSTVTTATSTIRHYHWIELPTFQK